MYKQIDGSGIAKGSMIEVVGKDSRKITLETAVDSLVAYCQEKGYALAIWQLPNTSHYHFLVSYSPKIIQQTEVEKLSKGFLLAEFEKGAKGERLYLPADVYFAFDQEVTEEQSLLWKEQLPGLALRKRTESISTAHIVREEQDKSRYENLVSTAMARIEAGEFKKLVLARKKMAILDGDASVGDLFGRLSRKYRNTFNHTTYTKEYGLWMGASPELLVSKNAQEVFRTIALAGTQKANDRNEKEAIWSQKEIEEQAYVSRFIVERLKRIRLREFDDIGPKTVRVGHLFHLKTEFLVDLKEVDFPNLLTTMLDLLHPTSAVCGMPREEAIDFVLKNEGFQRELYSGYLGPVNVGDEIHLFVNLRCAKISNHITFYAGAGVTEDSVPEREFWETEAKMDSMLSLFGF